VGVEGEGGINGGAWVYVYVIEGFYGEEVGEGCSRVEGKDGPRGGGGGRRAASRKRGRGEVRNSDAKFATESEVVDMGLAHGESINDIQPLGGNCRWVAPCEVGGIFTNLCGLVELGVGN